MYTKAERFPRHWGCNNVIMPFHRHGPNPPKSLGLVAVSPFGVDGHIRFLVVEGELDS